MNRIVLNALWATLHFYVGWRLCASLAEWPWLTAIAWAMTSEFTAAFSTIAWSTLATGTAMFVLLSTLVITVLGMWNARRTAAIVKVDVPISGLPAALHGFAIAQISDIHVGPTIKGRYVDAIVNAVNRLNAGVTDVSAHHFDSAHRSSPQSALANAPEHVFVRVLLAHQPRSAHEAANAGFNLQLSGHTHGGQFWPWNFFVRLQQPFTAGLHRLQGLWVYVSRGTGYWGPPKRFGASSEITYLRLVKERC